MDFSNNGCKQDAIKYNQLHILIIPIEKHVYTGTI